MLILACINSDAPNLVDKILSNFKDELAHISTSPMQSDEFEGKIVYSEIVYQPHFYFDTKGFYNEATSFIMTGQNLRYLTALLNSKCLAFAFKEFYSGGKLGAGFRYKKVFLENLPIPTITPQNENLTLQIANLVDICQSLNEDISHTKRRFYENLELKSISKRLEKFDELSFDEFILELAKAKMIKFQDKLDERNFKDEWHTLFEADKAAVCKLKAQISNIENKIDDMVFKLYELNNDEIHWLNKANDKMATFTQLGL